MILITAPYLRPSLRSTPNISIYVMNLHNIRCLIQAFQSGTVHWDDEDSRNKNSAGGELPSGKFGRNTEIDYCCR